MGPIVTPLEKEFGKKLLFVYFYVNDESNRKAIEASGIKRVPTVWFVDRKNQIRSVLVGCDQDKLKAEMEKLVKETAK